MTRYLSVLLAIAVMVASQGASAETTSLFDGETFDGWEGDTAKTWRVENGAITAGSLEEAAPRNEFLATIQEYENFDLRLKFKITGTHHVNAGVQFRTRRIPNHHEVSGFQADIGAGVDGHLYDESRRRRMLASPDKETLTKAQAAIADDGWQTYRIQADGNHIQLWLNGVQTVDYIEKDETIPRSGIIAVQIHGGMKAIIAYKDIMIAKLAILKDEPKESSIPAPDSSRLADGLIGKWSFDSDATGKGSDKTFASELTHGAKLVPSPFGKALSLDGRDDYIVGPRDPALDIGDGEFSVAAWIRPHELRQGGIFCLGRYSWTHGWYFDMPSADGILRIETVSPQNRGNGTVQSQPWMLKVDRWTHVAVVVKRGQNATRLYINGFESAAGTVHATDLDNPTTKLHIGRIEGAQLFKGEIDEVYFYRRALEPAEIQALVEPGREFATKPVSVRPPAASVKRFATSNEKSSTQSHFADREFTLEAGEVVVFTGQTDIVRSRHDAMLESVLASNYADAKPRFRNMAWEGDTVYQQWRDLNFGTWEDQLRAVGATVVFAQFGQMESLDGTERIGEFISAYEKLLDQFERLTQRIVLVSPRPFEQPISEHMPDHRDINDAVKKYVEAISELAKRRDYVFVDLFTPSAGLEDRLTINGIHLTPEGHPKVAAMIADSLGVPTSPFSGQLADVIREKNRLWFDNWRPMNWTFAFGDRTTQPFSAPGGDRPALRFELEEFKPLIENADQRIHDVASGQSVPGISQQEPTSWKLTADQHHSPASELASFSVADGFEVNLFADETDGVVNPLQMRWDDRGRLWVLCAPTYPHVDPGKKPGDYLLVCEDTDGDGKADKFDRFAEGLFIAMGLAFGGGGVYLCENTELVHLKDTDGDGRADSREVLLSGFGTADSHQMINGLTWGPSGELWFTQGHHAYSHIETPHGVKHLHKAGVWRYRPRTGQLDSFFNMSTAGLNCQGVAYDQWGQIFHNSAAWSGGFYTSGGAIPTSRPLKYMSLAVPDRRNTGIEFIHSEHLPDDLQGAVVWGGFMSNSVQLHRLVDDGGGFTAEVIPDLMKSTRRDFRPVNVRVGPDGALYVCDWYNAVIGHYQASYRDPKRDHSRGRIWRVTAKGRPLATQPDLSKLSPIQLLDLLRSSEGLTRYNAKRKLFDLPTTVAIAAVDQWVSRLDPQDPQLEQLLLQVIGVYEAHEVVRPDILQRLLDANDPRVRAYGTRVVGNWTNRLDQSNLASAGNGTGVKTPVYKTSLRLLRKSIHDEHPRVRLEAIVACSYIKSPEAIEVAAMAGDLPRGRYINYALNQCVDALKPYWYPAMQRGELRFDGQAQRLQLILELDGTKDVAGLIRRLLADSDASGDARERLMSLLVSVGSPNDLEYAMRQAGRSPAVLRELVSVARVHRRRPAGDLVEALKPILDEESVELKTLGIQLAGVWRTRPLTSQVQRQLSSDAPEAVVRAAIIALAQLNGDESKTEIAKFASANQPANLQAAAIQAISEFDVTSAATLAAPLLSASRDQSLTAELMTPLLSHQTGIDTLATGLRGQSLSRDAATLMHRVLSAAGRSDERLLGVLNEAIGTRGEKLEYDGMYVRQLAADVISRGDPERGRELFHSKLANCTACHKLNGKGGDNGPDLTIIGAGRSPELLTESVLWPNRQIREGFMSIKVLTDEGRVYTGYRLKETDDELHLKDTSTGDVRRIAQDSIENVVDAGSVMPAGLTANMTREEARDLIRFLTECKEGQNR